MPADAFEREILRPRWKVPILHHEPERPIVGQWILEELREYSYRVSPGTLYPLLARMVKLGWLEPVGRRRRGKGKEPRRLRATAAGRRALPEVES